MMIRIRRDYTCGTCEGEEIVQTTNSFFEAAKAVVGKLSRRLQVQVLPGAPEMQLKVESEKKMFFTLNLYTFYYQ